MRKDMLEHLFGSKTRMRLLTLFLHRPNEVFFVREITRLIDTQINAVRRELGNLTELGMLLETETLEEEGEKRPGRKRKYYKINDRFPLLEEIRMLMTKAHLLMERRFDQEIAALGTVHYLAFMGNFLGRKAPVDLLLVGTVDSQALRSFIQRLEKDLGFEINFTAMTLQEFKYRKEMYDRFLASVLESPKNVILNTLEGVEERK